MKARIIQYRFGPTVEQWASVARMKPDVIVGCSRQRTDAHEALSFQNRTCAYATGAYLLRALVSMGSDSPTGGGSCAVAPDGTVFGSFTNEGGHGIAVQFRRQTASTIPS